MSSQLNRHDEFDWVVESPQLEQAPKYQAFDELNSQSPRLEELLFFGQLALFCVTTALISFFFLSLGLSAVIALPVSCAISFGLTKTAKRLILNN